MPYAPNDVQRYGQEIRLWTVIINKKGGRKVSSKLIVRQAKKLKNQQPPETDTRGSKKVESHSMEKI